MAAIPKNLQYIKFCAYGFLKNLRFFDAFLLLFFYEQGLSYTQIGILYALREVITHVFEIPSGIVADTLGRKHALVGAFTAYMLSFILFYQGQAFSWFVIAMMLYGGADAFRSGTHKGMIMDYLKQHQWQHLKVAYYGNTRAWSQRGSALSALVAGGLVFYEGTYKAIFLYSLIPYALNMFNIMSYPANLNKKLKQVAKPQVQSLKENVNMLIQAMKQPRLLGILNSDALHTAFAKAVKDYIQPLLLQIALVFPLFSAWNADQRGAIFIGVTYFFIYLWSAYASRNAAKVAGVSGIAHYTLLGGLGAGVICGVSYAGAYGWISLLGFVGIYLIQNLRKPIMTGFVTERVPGAILTSVLSALSFWRTLLTAAIAFLLGICADHLGIGLAIALVSGMLLLLGLLTVFSFLRRQTAG